MTKHNPKSKQILDHDEKISTPNSFLKTQKEHKKWFDTGKMGKQLGKPKAVPKESRKQKGTAKHSLRKER